MGLGLDKQLKYCSDLSTGVISLDGDIDTIITINDNLPVASLATRISATEVNFEITGHATFNLSIGSFIRTSGWTPAAYNITGVVLSLPDANNVRVVPLSDPVTNATGSIGVWDAGSINVAHNGVYRIVERPSLYVPRSKMRAFSATNNIDHSAIASDGNLQVIVDVNQVISIIQQASGEPVLPTFNGAGIENSNTHVQLGVVAKQAGIVDAPSGFIQWNGNIHNRYRFGINTVGVLNVNQDVDFTGGDLTLIYKQGSILSTDTGLTDTGGVDQDQNILTSDINNVTIITVNRNNIIQSVGTSVNVLNFESPVGTFAVMPNNTAANRFYVGFINPNFAGGGFLGGVLGQETFSGGSALADAAASTEALDIPGIIIRGVKLIKASILKNETDLVNATKTKLNKFS